MPKRCANWPMEIPLYRLDEKKLVRTSTYKTRAWLLTQRAYPPRLRGVSSKQWRLPSSTTPGLQLLATCRRAYYEYYVWLYARNSFHLEPGFESLLDEHHLTYFARLRPVHWTMIQRLVIAFSISDLTPHGLTVIEYNFHRLRNRAWDALAGYAPWAVFYAWTLLYLAQCWSLKIYWLAHHVYGKEIILVGYQDRQSGGGEELVLERSTRVTFAGDCTTWEAFNRDLNPDIRTFVDANWRRIMPVLRAEIVAAFEGDRTSAGVAAAGRRRGGGGGERGGERGWRFAHCSKAVERFKAWVAQQEELERSLQQRPLPRNWEPRAR